MIVTYRRTGIHNPSLSSRDFKAMCAYWNCIARQKGWSVRLSNDISIEFCLKTPATLTSSPYGRSRCCDWIAEQRCKTLDWWKQTEQKHASKSDQCLNLFTIRQAWISHEIVMTLVMVKDWVCCTVVQISWVVSKSMYAKMIVKLSVMLKPVILLKFNHIDESRGSRVKQRRSGRLQIYSKIN